jgi:hypothetical protein
MATGNATLKCTTCGAEFDVSKKCGSSRAARQWEEHMANGNGTCPNCRKAEKQAVTDNRIVEAQQVLADNFPSGLPELTGSEKQVAWAQDIRLALVYTLSKKGFKFEALGLLDTFSEAERTMLTELKGILYATSAKTFIDSRGSRICGGAIKVLDGMREI